MPEARPRDRWDEHLGKMIIISVLIHVVVVALALWSPVQPRTRWTFGPVYSVALVSLPKGRPAAAGKITEITPAMAPRHPAIALRKPIEMTAGESLRRIEVPKSQPGETPRIQEGLPAKPAASPAQGTAEKMAAVEKTTTRESTATAGSQTQGVAAGGGRAGGGGGPAESTPGAPALTEAEINQKIQSYYRLLWQEIRQHWTIPPSLLPRENLMTVVIVKIARNGNVSELGYEKRSGHPQFDESAVRAVKKASPFPPLPEWISNNEIEIGIRFHSSELR